ncbi:MAG TPA: LysM peptidoglycan-binding domain-containing protein [Myxococcota bacterium]|nr:LysM peptidoglycan-binding domain-containing protein [Myxococcota bacterium]
MPRNLPRLFACAILLIAARAPAADEGKVILPLSFWEQKLLQLEAPNQPIRPPVSICPIERKIDGVFRKGLLSAELVASFEVLDSGGHIRVPVLDGTASLGEVLLNGKRTSLLVEGGMYTVGVDRPGNYRINLRFFWGKEQDRFARRLHFRLPEAGATRLSILVPEKDIEARLTTGALIAARPEPGGTRLVGNLDAAGIVDLSWTRKLTHRAAGAVRLSAGINALLTVHEAMVTGVAVFDMAVLEGETDRLDLQLPAGIEVVNVDGPAVLQWLTESDGGLTVLLRYLVEDKARVAVSFQYPIENGKPVRLSLPLPKKDTPMSGALGVQAPAGLDVRVASVEAASELRDLPPDLTELSASPLLFGFGFKQPPRISLAVSRHTQVELTSTLIDEIQASSVIIEDGTEITKLKVRMRNNTEQYLSMHLPADAVLTHSLIDGRPVRPAVAADQAGEALLFPLRQSERIGAGNERFHVVRQGETLSDISNFYYAEPGRWRGILENNPDQLANENGLMVGQRLLIPAKKGLIMEESSFTIELAYKRHRKEMGSLGSLRLSLPSMDVDTMKVVWHLYFPAALTPLSFGGNLTQYSAIRYDPFRRIRDFLNRALFTHEAWAGGKYKSILLQRKAIYQIETQRKGKGEVVLAAFPLAGTRYRFKRLLLERETPTITVTYVSRALAPVVRWGAFLLSFVLALLLLGQRRSLWTWLAGGGALLLLLFLSHYFIGAHRRIIWGVDLALLVALVRLRAGPLWRGFMDILRCPWQFAGLLTFRSLALVVGLSAVLWIALMFPLLLSSLAAVVLFLWWRRKARLAGREVANA